MHPKNAGDTQCSSDQIAPLGAVISGAALFAKIFSFKNFTVNHDCLGAHLVLHVIA